MTWSYDPADLTTETPSGRVNSVRLLVGDTDFEDQQVQNEEIAFGLTQSGENVYFAASWIAYTLSSKYARLVNTDLDGALSEDLSDLSEHYKLLSITLRQQGQRFSGGGLNAFGGGLTKTYIEAKRANDNLVRPSFTRDRFRDPETGYLSEDYSEETL